MYRHYFKIAWRSMLKQKLYTAINIIGLALGLSCFMLIFLYIRFERSFDQFYEQADQVYRIIRNNPDNYLGKAYSAPTPAGLAPTLLEEFPEVVHATTLIPNESLLELEDDTYYEKGISADTHFFDVFPMSFVQGEPQTALDHVNGIVLTESLARKFFGRADPMGQVVNIRGDALQVTGVIEDLPANSSLDLSYLMNIESFPDYKRDKNFSEKWYSNSFYTFFRLLDGADPLVVQNKLPAMLTKYGQGGEIDLPFEITYFVQALSDLHLDISATEDIGQKGNAQYVSWFSLIAVGILLLACVNYMNLAIARSIRRAKEVGLRKVIGAQRQQLIGQFIGESILLAFLALVLAVGLCYLLAPIFSYLLEQPIALNFIENLYLLPALLTLVLLVGVLSGSYPAFFMSAQRPTVVLKGTATRKNNRQRVQRGLIVGQYAASIMLAICSLVIYRQIQFVQQKELGFDKEQVVTIPIRDNKIHDQLDVLKNEWLDHSNIIGITASSSLPIYVDARRKINYNYEKGGVQEGSLEIYRVRTDPDYLNVFSMELLAGRNFSAAIASDLETGRIINESAAKALGWTAQEAVGKQFADLGVQATVIGVIGDFHMQSMRQAIEPVMLTPNRQYEGYLSVKVRPDNLQTTIALLQESIKGYSAFPFEYSFLDVEFDQLYKADLRLGELFSFFTVLALTIACLGLFGLAAFATKQRTKEMGIRKILGASAQSIVRLLSRDFLKMVLFGFLLAIPIAWYVMHQWMEGFTYRIGLEWWVFALVGLTAMLLAFLTVGSQSILAAFSNPVEALRNE